MIKNKLIKLGIITTTSPIVSIISCGINEPTENQVKEIRALESTNSMNKIEEDWWKYIIKNEKIKNFNSKDLLSSLEIKNNFDYLLKNEIYKNSSYLYNLSIQISNHKEFSKILKTEGNKEPEVKLNEWGFYVKELSEKKTIDIEEAIEENKGLKLEAKKFIVKNITSFRKKLYKFTIARRYLKNKINKEKYKKIFFNKDDSFTELQDLYNHEEFHLINETLKQKLFLNWEIELSEYDSVDYFGIKVNSEKTYDQIKSLITINPNNNTKGELLTKQPILNLDSKTMLKNILNTSEYNKYKIYGGYSGIKKQSNIGNSLLSFKIDGLKRATNKRLWEGYIFDNRFINNKENTIIRNIQKMTLIPENEKKVNVHFVKGLMPIYKNGKLTFKGSDFETEIQKEYLYSILSLEKNVYESAIKYYTKRENNPILLKLKEPIKKIAIDYGFKFIKK